MTCLSRKAGCRAHPPLCLLPHPTFSNLCTLCSGGAVVVGDSVITFVSAQGVRSAAIKPTVIKVRTSLVLPLCRVQLHGIAAAAGRMSAASCRCLLA